MTIDIDTAVRTMRSANPVPDPVSLATAMADSTVFLDVTKEATQMDTYQDTNKTTEEARSPGGGLRIAVAAFVAVLLVGAAALFIQQANDAPPAASPEEMAEAFMAARNAGDGDASLALLSDDAVFRDDGDTDAAVYAEELAFFPAMGWVWTLGECTDVEDGPATTLTCGYSHGNDWTRAMGIGPIDDGGQLTFKVEDGKITAFRHRWAQTTFSDIGWGPMIGWIEANHLDQIFDITPDGCCDALKTPEAIALWKQFTEEFVAEQAG